MPPRRRKGVAKPIKKSKRDKYVYFDSDGNPVSGSTSKRENAVVDAAPPKPAPKQQSRSAAGAPSPPQKLSTAALPPMVPGQRSRQDSIDDPKETAGPPEEQSAARSALAQALFSDLLAQDAVDSSNDNTNSINNDHASLECDERGHRVLPSVEAAPASDLYLAPRIGSPLARLALTPSTRGGRCSQEQEKDQEQLQAPAAAPVPAPPRPSTLPSRQASRFEAAHHPEDALEIEHPAMSGSYIPPSQHRHMRACMVCAIVRTEQQFKQNGCPNCEAFLELANNSDAIQECTSQVFDGLIVVTDTSRSWVARHQRLEGYVPGTYAVQVEGVLPDEAIAAAENAGVHYVPRDGSVNEALPTDA